MSSSMDMLVTALLDLYLMVPAVGVTFIKPADLRVRLSALFLVVYWLWVGLARMDAAAADLALVKALTATAIVVGGNLLHRRIRKSGW